jgi:gluconate 2-dehydrogenase gamma chain
MMLSDGDRTTLAAVLERLIPGAAEAQVIRYVERVAARDAAIYREGLASLAGFASLPAAEQDAVLARLEGDEFFELVRLHAIQGMFGDPLHGGNAGHAGWDLLGFPGAKVTYTAEDQALDVDVRPVR